MPEVEVEVRVQGAQSIAVHLFHAKLGPGRDVSSPTPLAHYGAAPISPPVRFGPGPCLSAFYPHLEASSVIAFVVCRTHADTSCRSTAYFSVINLDRRAERPNLDRESFIHRFGDPHSFSAWKCRRD